MTGADHDHPATGGASDREQTEDNNQSPPGDTGLPARPPLRSHGSSPATGVLPSEDGRAEESAASSDRSQRAAEQRGAEPRAAERRAAEQRAAESQESFSEQPTRQFRAAAGNVDPPAQAPLRDDQGYHTTTAFSVAPDQHRNPAPAEPSYQQYSQPDYGSASTGFFSPQAVHAARVEVAPATARIGQNLLGALLGLILVAGALALYAVAFKNAANGAGTGTGHKIALIGIAVLIALPALLSGWAPAAGWVPGIVLVLGVGVALFTPSLAQTIAGWSDSLFGTPIAAQLLVDWGMVVGFALLFAGVAGYLARRSSERAVLNRLVQR